MDRGALKIKIINYANKEKDLDGILPENRVLAKKREK